MRISTSRGVVGRLGCQPQLLLVIALGSVGGGTTVVATQASHQPFVKAEYRIVQVSKDAPADPVIVEEGTYLIDRQGRYRIDRYRGTAHTAEIVDHVRRERSALDMDRKLVVTWSAGGPRSEWPALPSGPIPVESLASGQSQRGEPMGIKAIPGGLTLEGVRFIFNIDQGGAPVTLTMERWYLPFNDRTRPPVMLETRFEDAVSVTTHEVVSAKEIPADERAFTIPRSFSRAR